MRIRGHTDGGQGRHLGHRGVTAGRRDRGVVGRGLLLHPDPERSVPERERIRIGPEKLTEAGGGPCVGVVARETGPARGRLRREVDDRGGRSCARPARVREEVRGPGRVRARGAFGADGRGGQTMDRRPVLAGRRGCRLPGRTREEGPCPRRIGSRAAARCRCGGGCRVLRRLLAGRARGVPGRRGEEGAGGRPSASSAFTGVAGARWAVSLRAAGAARGVSQAAEAKKPPASRPTKAAVTDGVVALTGAGASTGAREGSARDQVALSSTSPIFRSTEVRGAAAAAPGAGAVALACSSCSASRMLPSASAITPSWNAPYLIAASPCLVRPIVSRSGGSRPLRPSPLPCSRTRRRPRPWNRRSGICSGPCPSRSTGVRWTSDPCGRSS